MSNLSPVAQGGGGAGQPLEETPTSVRKRLGSPGNTGRSGTTGTKRGTTRTGGGGGGTVQGFIVKVDPMTDDTWSQIMTQMNG